MGTVRKAPSGWFSRAWPAYDLVLWTCVVAVACMDILTTVVGLRYGPVVEGNQLGAAAWAAGEGVGLLQVKLAALFAILAVWVAVPVRWRGYVRAGTVAGGLVTYAAAAHNALLLFTLA